jgi:hypothetical protein
MIQDSSLLHKKWLLCCHFHPKCRFWWDLVDLSAVSVSQYSCKRTTVRTVQYVQYQVLVNISNMSAMNNDDGEDGKLANAMKLITQLADTFDKLSADEKPQITNLLSSSGLILPSPNPSPVSPGYISLRRANSIWAAGYSAEDIEIRDRWKSESWIEYAEEEARPKMNSKGRRVYDGAAGESLDNHQKGK